jgi:hypothetical protein
MAKTKPSNTGKRKKSSSLKVHEALCVKVAISMPSEDLYRIEKARKQLNLSRSKFMLVAVHHWFAAPRKQSLIEQYIRGYEMVPEDSKVSRELTAAQSQVLDKENW